MVARPTDTPIEVTERLADARKKVEELTRSVGRGTAALRDATNNVLELANAASPLLRNEQTGLGILYSATGEIMVVSSDGAQFRNMKAATLSADKDIVANGNMSGVNVNASGKVSADTIGANSAVFGPLTAGFTQVGNFKSAQINTVGDIYTPGYRVSTDPGGEMRSLDYYGGYFRGVYVNTSDARLKENHTPVNEEDITALSNVEVTEWNYKESTHNLDENERYVGPVAQDMPEIAVVTDPDGKLGIDQVTYTGLLLALVQRQKKELEDMRKTHDEYVEKNDKEMFKLRCDVDDLKESVKILTQVKRLAN